MTAKSRECPRCGRWFSWALDLIEHRVRAHGDRL
jgi:uncharacterized C2H2 Zn-finger protein